MRLNLGCGKDPLPGYTNVDLHERADVRVDVLTADFEEVEEVRMHHLLEHLPFAQTRGFLERVRRWMAPGAEIVVEVPDMEALMANPREGWVSDIYGSQLHDGEFHKAGFTEPLLVERLQSAGFSDVTCERFVSEHPWREGMPCLLARGRA